jgi:hypothetical protein
MMSCARASVRITRRVNGEKRSLPTWHRALASAAPFGNDLFPIAAIAATPGIDRLGDVAEADDCAVANRTDFFRRHRCTC